MVGRFPQGRQFHSLGFLIRHERHSFLVEAAHQMRTKGDRNRIIQMFMNSDAAAGERGAQLTAFELPDPIGKAHRVVARHHPLVLQ